MFGKAQIRITESVLVLFIFFILLIFGLIFYVQQMQAHVQDLKSEEQIKNSLLVLNQVLNLPAIQCSFDNRVDSICLDWEKVIVFSNLIETDASFTEFYFNKFGYGEFTLQQIFYQESNPIDFYSILKEGDRLVYTVPVSIYSNNNYEIGMLTVEVIV